MKYDDLYNYLATALLENIAVTTQKGGEPAESTWAMAQFLLNNCKEGLESYAISQEVMERLASLEQLSKINKVTKK